MSKSPMSAQMKVAAMRQRFLDFEARLSGLAFDRFMAKCESPIEQLLMGEMLSRCLLTTVPYRVKAVTTLLKQVRSPEGAYPTFCGEIYSDAVGNGHDITLFGQMPILIGTRAIRLDAAIAIVDWSTDATAWVAVECDGHDFHERSKAQAAADRSRDRALTEMGWRVVRFTGSEIFANVAGCVDELERILAVAARNIR